MAVKPLQFGRGIGLLVDRSAHGPPARTHRAISAPAPQWADACD